MILKLNAFKTFLTVFLYALRVGIWKAGNYLKQMFSAALENKSMSSNNCQTLAF